MDNKIKAAFHSLGCKVNSYETEKMAKLLSDGGFTIVPFDSAADYYIINTCSVTNIADRKSRQMLHRAKAMNPAATIVAAGCYVNTHEGDAALLSDVDILIPNEKKGEILEILLDWEKEQENTAHEGAFRCPKAFQESPGSQSHDSIESNKQNITQALENQGQQNTSCASTELNKQNINQIWANPANHSQTHTPMESDKMGMNHVPAEQGHTRAFLKVQDGCNNFCSYCVIPYARGRIKSRPTSDVLSEIRDLVDKGYLEFVLTGIHLSSYGLDRKESGETLLSLIQNAAAIRGVRRIRLGSLEPTIITEDFVKALFNIPSLCPHFHLSLQSGCNSVLKRMNRHYTAEEFIEGVELLRTAFPNPALTTDVIVGFPGESDEEFEETSLFLDRVRFYETHIFKYSRRKGTAADKLPLQLTETVKTERSRILIEKGLKNKALFMDSLIGKEAELLTEEPITIDGISYYTGYTKEYVRAAIRAESALPNHIYKGKTVRRLNSEILIFE